MPHVVPYPLRAARVNFSISPFNFRWRPIFTHKRDLTETSRADGATIWWIRWGWFQISYNRWR